VTEAPDLSHLDDPELDRALRARRIARWKKAGVALLALLGIGVFAYSVLLPAIGGRWAVRMLEDMQGTPFPRLLERREIVEFGRAYGGAMDTLTSPEEAGRALHAMLKWSPAGHDALLQPWTPDIFNPLASPVPDSNPLHLAPDRWPRELLPLAGRGLTPEQRTFLVSVAAAGGDTLFAIFARATRADIMGTRYKYSAKVEMPTGGMLIPIPYNSPLYRAAAARLARSALAVSSRRYLVADSALREVTNSGLLLWDHDVESFEDVVGARLVYESLRARAALDSIEGREEDSRRITRFLDGVRKSAPVDSFFERRPSIGDQIAVLQQKLRDPKLPRGLHWNLLKFAVVGIGTRYCAGLLSERGWRAWSDSARAALVHTAGDERYFNWIAHQPSEADCRDGLGSLSSR
jgi:hypothetical protein